VHSPLITHPTGILPSLNSHLGFVPPSPTSLAHTYPSLSHLRTQTGQLLLVSLPPSGFTFSAYRPLSRDRSKSPISVVKASQVKGLVVSRLHLQVWPPLLPTILLPHPHTANSPPPCKALASESMLKGNRLATHCLSSARSLRSSSLVLRWLEPHILRNMQ